MQKNIRAFTFVELIIVIAIIAIISTVGFISYQGYSSDSRDTNRIAQLYNIKDGLERMSLTSKLPNPENSIEVFSGGTLLSNQGYAGENVIRAIGYSGGRTDPDGGYFTYMLAKNGKNFQLLGYLENAENLSSLPPSLSETQVTFPKVVGDELGILVDDTTLLPLQDVEPYFTDKEIDVSSVTSPDSIRGYKTDSEYDMYPSSP